ncbi:MAG: putative LPS assembly protein LptD [Ferruginibacter sp.]
MAGLLLLMLTQFSRAELFFEGYFHNTLTADTIPKPNRRQSLTPTDINAIKKIVKEDSIKNSKIKPDTVIIPRIDSFSVKYSKDSLNAPIEYHADDSMILDVPTKKLFLYGKESKVNSEDNELTAPFIQYDQKTNVVTAYMLKDSLGNVLKYAKFKQGDFSSASDTLRFDLLSKKGQTKGTYFTQNDLYVYALKTKKKDSNTIHANYVRFTTCNLDTPHFAFVSRRVIFINKKVAFTGPVHPEIEGVPIPIVLPFGIYPLKQGRHSGILAPTFSANDQLGLSLEGLGYYKVLNDNWDITTLGTLYSYGGWTARINPRYYKRYHYQGNFSLDVQHLNIGLNSDSDQVKTRTFNVTWSHTADTKSRPGVTFSANVNAGSSKYNQFVPNNPVRNFQNQLSSSISYAKVWKDKPFNLSINANHNQNTLQQVINLNLPDIAFNLNTQYPFRKANPAGELKWYENIGVALNTNAKSLTYFSDSVGAIDIATQIRKNFQWGASHNIPITLSLPQLGAFQLSPNVNYQERWYQRKLLRNWDPAAKKVDSIYKDGFYSSRDMSFSLSLNTRIFGMFQFGKNSKVQAIRHEIRPNIGFSYKPDLSSQFYNTIQVDTFGNRARLSVFDGSVYGAFSEGKSGSITFGVDNNVQMKVKNKKDTGEAAIKKITILDGLSIGGSYNLLADSFALSDFNISARSNLFDKVNITAGAVLSPYQVNSLGNRVKTLVWKDKFFSLGRLVTGSVAMSTQFKGGDKKSGNDSKTNPALQQQYNPSTGLPLDEYQQELTYINNNPGQFVDFKIPWTVNLSYSLTFYKQLKADYTGFTTVFTQDATFNGDVNLTAKWKVGTSGSFNITRKELGQLSVFISREMHCWQMAINISPVGTYRYFNISISPKSGLLRDLKINRTRSFYEL